MNEKKRKQRKSENDRQSKRGKKKESVTSNHIVDEIPQGIRENKKYLEMLNTKMLTAIIFSFLPLKENILNLKINKSTRKLLLEYNSPLQTYIILKKINNYNPEIGNFIYEKYLPESISNGLNYNEKEEIFSALLKTIRRENILPTPRAVFRNAQARDEALQFRKAKNREIPQYIQLLTMLEQNNELTRRFGKINLFSGYFQSNVRTAFSNMLKTNNHIEEIVIEYATFENSNLLFQNSLRFNTSIRKLSFNRTILIVNYFENLQEEFHSSVPRTTPVNTSVQEIEIKNCTVNDLIVSIFRLLNEARSIKKLVIENCIFENTAFPSYIERLNGILNINSSLTELNLNNNRITDTVFTFFCQALRGNTALEKLSIKSNSFGSNTNLFLENMGDLLINTERLIDIDYTCNYLSKEVVEAIEEMTLLKIHGMLVEGKLDPSPSPKQTKDRPVVKQIREAVGKSPTPVKNYFSKISVNLINYLLSYLNTSECLVNTNVNKLLRRLTLNLPIIRCFKKLKDMEDRIYYHNSLKKFVKRAFSSGDTELTSLQQADLIQTFYYDPTLKILTLNPDTFHQSNTYYPYYNNAREFYNFKNKDYFEKNLILLEHPKMKVEEIVIYSIDQKDSTRFGKIMKENKTLHTVKLNLNTKSMVKHFLPYINFNPNIKSIIIGVGNEKDIYFNDSILPVLNENKTITRLRFENVRFRKDDITQLINFFSYKLNPSLRILEIESFMAPQGKNGHYYMGNFITSLATSTIEKLTITGMLFQTNELEALTDMIKVNNNLKNLKLNFNSRDYLSLARFLQSLQLNRSLISLTLGTEIIKVLSEVLCESIMLHPCLEHLNLKNSRMTDNDFAEYLPLLCHSTLKELFLPQCGETGRVNSNIIRDNIITKQFLHEKKALVGVKNKQEE